MNWSLYSKHRQSLMGVAILWIMLYHINLNLGVLSYRIVFEGFYGVEVFAFLSGIGAYYSLHKNENIKAYYIRKFKRVIPIFYWVEIPYTFLLVFMGCYTAVDAVRLLFFLNPFFDIMMAWYVTFVIICYLFSPFLYRMILNGKYGLLFLSIIICYLIGYFYCPIIFNRLPMFVVGMMIGKYILLHKTESSSKSMWIHVLIGFVCILYVCGYVGKCCDFLVIKQVMTLYVFYCIAVLFDKLKCVEKPFAFLGGLTLELYLIHESICIQLIHNRFDNKIILALVGIFLAIIISLSINRLQSHIVSRMK